MEKERVQQKRGNDFHDLKVKKKERAQKSIKTPMLMNNLIQKSQRLFRK
jgi:hypothetical protein